MGLVSQASSSLGAILLCALVSSSCKEPTEPDLAPLPSVNAANEVRAIQLEEQRRAEEVKLVGRREPARELDKRYSSLASGQVGQGGSGSPAALSSADAGAAAQGEITGKLERALPDVLMIRNASGFAYWLYTNGTTRITLNGHPAHVRDFKPGADVRASFVWQGRERIATDVEVVDAGNRRDGGTSAG